MFAFDISIPSPVWVGTEADAIKWRDYMLNAARREGGLGLDTETSGRDDKNKEWVIVWSLSDGNYRLCLPAQFLAIFKDAILENPEVNFDMSNANFDSHRLANSGIDISKAGAIRDTTVQSWLLNENNLGGHGLKDTTKALFNRETPEFEDVFGKVPPKKTDETGRIISKTTADLIYEAFSPYFNPEKVPVLAEEYARKEWKKRDGEGALQELIHTKIQFIHERFQRAIDYSSLDAYNSTMCRRKFDEFLANQPGMNLKEYFHNVEVPFTKVLYKMERRGITIDLGHLEEQEGPILQEMGVIEKEFAREAGQPMNLKSTLAIGFFFYDKLKKPVKHWTKGGTTGNRKPSTEESVLAEWAEDGDPWAKLMMKYRTISKIHGTYIKGLRTHVDQYLRIHTTLNQHGTVTGRLSSKDPNLQNIPRASEDAFKIREAFVSGVGKVLVVADYAQLEMRLMAHFSGDQKMIKAIRDGVDLHCLSVSEMYGIPYDEVIAAVKAEKKIKRKELERDLTAREQELLFYRQGCKSTGFGIIYGIGGPKLAAQLSEMGDKVLTDDEGFALIEKWYGIFPGVKSFVNDVHIQLQRVGHVQTILGRFRRFGDVRGMSFRDRGQAERQGVNSIIQGTASDLAKAAMIIAEHDEVLRDLGATLLLQIHDELLWECPDKPEVISAVKKRVQEIMETPLAEPLRVPIPAEVGHGYTWATAK